MLCASRFGVPCLDWSEVEVDHGQRFLNVELSWFAVRSDSIPVVQAVGRIARLLDFCNHQAGADSVHGAGGDQQTVTDGRFKEVQARLRGSIFDGLL